MLNKILIKNIVLIKEINIEFKSGLSVLTGETGTGKSIIIDSLGLILGNRANFKLIKRGEDKAAVTAVFKVSNQHKVCNFLKSINLDFDHELIIRREINKNGKSSSFVNDVPVSIQTLQIIGSYLIEIQGQFESHSLLNEKNHLKLLDGFMNDREMLLNVKCLWEDYVKNKIEFKNAQEIHSRNLINQEWISDSLDQLKKINLSENEEKEILNKRKYLLNQEKIISSYENARLILETDNGLNNQMRQLSSIFNKLEAIDNEEIKNLSELINETTLNIDEINSSLKKGNFNLDSSKKSLNELEERLYELRKQANKHKCKIDELPVIEKQLEVQLNNIENNEDNLKKLQNKLNLSLKKYKEKCMILSDERKKTALLMTNKINNELPNLRLEDAIFNIKFEQLEEENYNIYGIDKVFFEAKTNKGSNIGKLSEIASGGELSRFLLAIKVTIDHNIVEKTLIFDEVDSGIGGATASAVGEKLAKIGEKYQTIVVTHSPQVTAKGVNHYLIRKETIDDDTVSATIELSHQERVEEIARMLSDNMVTNEARLAATKLLEKNESKY